MPWLSKRVISYMESEIDFWRKKYEEERQRADALFDQAIQGVGLNPVGREAKAAEEIAMASVLKQAEQFKELLALEVNTEEKQEGANGNA